MKTPDPSLQLTVDSMLETLPPVWDRISYNLRTAAMGQFGISLAQFHVLRHIRHGCRSVGELAEKKQISPSAVSQAVEALVVKGLVTRVQESGDRRCVRLELTPRASDALDANFRENHIWMEGKMALLTPADLESIRKSMGILRKTFCPEEN